MDGIRSTCIGTKRCMRYIYIYTYCLCQSGSLTVTTVGRMPRFACYASRRARWGARGGSMEVSSYACALVACTHSKHTHPTHCIMSDRRNVSMADALHACMYRVDILSIIFVGLSRTVSAVDVRASSACTRRVEGSARGARGARGGWRYRVARITRVAISRRGA